jgi:hypothetical protein
MHAGTEPQGPPAAGAARTADRRRAPADDLSASAPTATHAEARHHGAAIDRVLSTNGFRRRAEAHDKRSPDGGVDYLAGRSGTASPRSLRVRGGHRHCGIDVSRTAARSK